MSLEEFFTKLARISFIGECRFMFSEKASRKKVESIVKGNIKGFLD
jgi:hypothetical protein